MSQEFRSNNSKNTSKQANKGLRVAIRFLVVVCVVSLVAIAGALLFVVLQPNEGNASVTLSGPSGASSLNPIEAVAIGSYLAVNQEALDQTPVIYTESAFVIEPGQSAQQIADNLVAAGIITDAQLFTRYARYNGFDVQMEAGTYYLNSSMTIPAIALSLTNALPNQITVRVPEGWRREQLADWIDEQPNLPFTGSDFLAATQTGAPTPAGLTFAPTLELAPTFEGYLYPDTYNLEPDATAQDFVALLLRTFDERVTLSLRADAAAQGYSLMDVVTIASIVEREAAVEDERPAIASVYLNRLAIGMRLEADPTVQYAMGYQLDRDEWWNRALTQADYQTAVSPFNTYLNNGIPPGPIASPSLSSIQAVVYADDTPYLFFRAACDGSGRHNFAITFEEHLANGCQ